MNYAVIDVETSKAPIHMPWTPGSFLSSVGIQHVDGTSKVWFFNPNSQPHEEIMKEVQAEFDSVDFLVGHNIKFDLNWLKWVGFKLKDKPVWCTMCADYLLQGQQKIGYSLNAVAERLGLGQKLDAMSMYWSSGYETDEIPLPIHEAYLKQDISLTHDVFKLQLELIPRAGLSKITDLYFLITQILSDMEVTGATFDKDEAMAYCTEARAQMQELNANLISTAGVDFLPSSTAQLAAVLFGGSWPKEVKEITARQLKSGKFKLTTRKSKMDFYFKGLGFTVPDGCMSEKTGKPKTDKNTIDLLKSKDKRAESFLDILRTQRKLGKVVATIAGSDEEKEEKGLVNVLGSDGRIHPSFNQCTTHTGRMSSSNPNGQNFPRKGTSPIKKFFKSTRGLIVNLDLAQIEWRIAAELSQDPTMIQELKDGLDIHSSNAIHVFGADKNKMTKEAFKEVRTTAKVLGFRSLYGGSATGFHRDQRMPDFSLNKWKKIVSSFYEKYRGLEAWQNRNKQLAAAQGYLRNPSGRILTFDNQVRQGVETVNDRQVCNFPVQSAASDIMYLCMVAMLARFKELGLTAQLILQVHDSMVFDAPESEVETICREAVKIFRSLPQIAKDYFGWNIVTPLDGDCEVGYNYGDTKEVKTEDFDTVFKDLKGYLDK